MSGPFSEGISAQVQRGSFDRLGDPKRSANEGIVSSSLSTIRDSLERLDGVLGDLRGKMNPILGSELPPGGDRPSAVVQTVSPLHDELESINLRVNNLRRQVETLMDRITL